MYSQPYHTNSNQYNYRNNSNTETEDLYQQYQYNFRPINKHACYPRIEAKLRQLSQNTQSMSLIKQSLSQFKFMTKQENKLKNLISQQKCNKNTKEQQGFYEMIKTIFKSLFQKIRISKNKYQQDNYLNGGQYNIGYIESQLKKDFNNCNNNQDYGCLDQFGQNSKVIQIFRDIAKYVLICGQSKTFQQQYDQYSISKIKICYSADNNKYNYTKQQILYILCLMTLNLIPTQYYNQDTRLNRYFNKNYTFCYIFNNQQNKTNVIINYFWKYSNLKYYIRIKQSLNKNILKINASNKLSQFSHYQNDNHHTNATTFPDQKYPEKHNNYHKQQNIIFSIQRNCVDLREISLLTQSTNIMGSYSFLPNQSTMEDYIQSNYVNPQKQKNQVNFANKYISGGALTHGLVQQQIIYMNHPELFVSIVLCQSMNHTESLHYKGFNKYFKNIGYGRSLLRFDQQTHKIQSLQSSIIAIDAQDFRNNRNHDQYQFQKQSIDRQITKAYSGFSNTSRNSEIVTGNWGCGIFCGNLQLKLMIQWIAGSLAQRDMIHCPYREEYKIFKGIGKTQFLSKLKGKKVKVVYDVLLQSCKKINWQKDNLLYLIYQSMCKLGQKQTSSRFYGQYLPYEAKQQICQPYIQNQKESKFYEPQIEPTKQINYQKNIQQENNKTKTPLKIIQFQQFNDRQIQKNQEYKLNNSKINFTYGSQYNTDFKQVNNQAGVSQQNRINSNKAVQTIKYVDLLDIDQETIFSASSNEQVLKTFPQMQNIQFNSQPIDINQKSLQQNNKDTLCQNTLMQIEQNNNDKNKNNQMIDQQDQNKQQLFINNDKQNIDQNINSKSQTLTIVNNTFQSLPNQFNTSQFHPVHQQIQLKPAQTHQQNSDQNHSRQIFNPIIQTKLYSVNQNIIY